MKCVCGYEGHKIHWKIIYVLGTPPPQKIEGTTLRACPKCGTVRIEEEKSE